MAQLTASQPTAEIQKGGFYHVQSELSGGSGTLQIKMQGATSFGDFADNTLSEGLVVVRLPKGTLQLVVGSGSPKVTIDKVPAQ